MDFKNLTVKEIKKMIKDLGYLEQIEYIEDLLEDSRKSVNSIGIKIRKKRKARIKDRNRIEKMWSFEKEQSEEFSVVAGIDEVGRGPLAGPVVAAAVILKPGTYFYKLDDSKKLNLEHRERLYNEIMKEAISVGIGSVGPEIIDKVNILNATKLAMNRAVSNLSKKPELLLIDAVTLDDNPIKQRSIIKGDELVVSISAASIIAKVTRDKLLYEYDEKYPGYGFSTNVGYGTKEHREALKDMGATPIHRKSFIKNFIKK